MEVRPPPQRAFRALSEPPPYRRRTMGEQRSQRATWGAASQRRKLLRLEESSPISTQQFQAA
eukprot:11826076-Alexandrium_andersonii.AAC.1